MRTVADGETLHAGDLDITAHATPGHTPGSTAWSWRSCEDGRCLDIVYVDSLNAVSAEGFRFTGGDRYPGRVDRFRASIAGVAALPCDVMITPHPGFMRLTEKLAARLTPQSRGLRQ